MGILRFGVFEDEFSSFGVLAVWVLVFLLSVRGFRVSGFRVRGFAVLGFGVLGFGVSATGFRG